MNHKLSLQKREYVTDFSTYWGALLGIAGGFLLGGISSDFGSGEAYIAGRSAALRLSTRGIVGGTIAGGALLGIGGAELAKWSYREWRSKR